MNESESKVTQSCPTLSNPMDFSLPGSSVRGIFQARVLEWVAIASLCTLYQFSNFNKENVHRSIYIYIYTLCFPIMYHCLSRKLHWWFSRYVISDSCDPMDCSLLGSSVRGIFQARVLEWIAISFSRGSSRPRNRTRVSRIAGRRFTIWATREAHTHVYMYINILYVHIYTHTYAYTISWIHALRTDLSFPELCL